MYTLQENGDLLTHKSFGRNTKNVGNYVGIEVRKNLSGEDIPTLFLVRPDILYFFKKKIPSHCPYSCFG